MSNNLIMRHQYESYMECIKGETPTYHLIGEGFTAASEAKNPKEYTRQYVHQKTERSDVVGYSPSISYSCDCVVGDPCVDEIISITDRELTGSETHRTIVSVNCWNEIESGEFEAYQREYAVVPDAKADGFEALIYTGSMKSVGDVVFGTFNRSTKTFTAETED